MSRIRTTTTAAAAAFLAAALVGCEGENLFTAPVTAGGDVANPAILAVVVPEFVQPPDVLDVEIQATGPEGIASLEVTLVETVTRTRTLTVDPPDPNVTEFTQFELLEPVARQSVLVRVQATDVLGRQSEEVEVAVPVVQGGD